MTHQPHHPSHGWRRKAIAAGAASCLALTLAPGALAAPTGDARFSSSFESDDPEVTQSTTFGDELTNITGQAGATGSLLPTVSEVTASGENPPSEVAAALADANPASKWLVFDKTAWAQYELQEPAAITSYSLTSANDASGRDPKDFEVLGSTDGKEWESIDSQKGQKFENRFETKTYELDSASAEYTYYRLKITAANGDSTIQLADWDLVDSNREEVLAPMTSQQGTGPSSSHTAKTGVGFTGLKSLEYAGRVQNDGEATATNELYDVDVDITQGMELSYKIFPVLDSDLTYASTYAAIDLVLSDGTRLSGSDLTDQNGFGANAPAQGDSDALWPDQWNSVKVDLSAFEGQTIEKVLLSYSIPDAPGGTVFRGYVDDVVLDQAEERDTSDGLISYVDTRRGTNSSGGFSRGNNIPAAAWPNGFNFITPMTNADSHSTLYQYQAGNNSENRPTLNGIGFSHQPSIWMGDRNQLAFMPAAGDSPTSKMSERRLAFDHDHEIARPDIYSVEFDNGIQTKVTPTDHGGLFSFTFTGDSGSVLMDKAEGDAKLDVSSDGVVSGWIHSGSDYPGRTRMFVYGTFDSTPIAQGKPAKGDRDAARYAAFDTSSDKTVELRVATSFISTDQAAKNLQLELEGRSFEDVQSAVQAEWEERLSVVTDVKGATDEQLVNLYSNLYRVNLYPNSQYENIGSADSPKYQYASPVSPTSGDASDTQTNAKLVDGKVFVNNGFWDTYRTEWPAIVLFYPDHAEDLVDGFVQQYRDGGWVSRWSSPGYADLMTGTSSDVAFAEAYLAGRLSNGKALDAYDAAVKNATTLPESSGVGRKGLDTSIFLGFTPESTHQSASWGLEGYINDFGIAEMAAALAEDPETPADRVDQLKDEAEYFEARSHEFGNMFNEKANTFTSRNADGSFPDGADFDKKDWGGAFTEASGWTFGYHAPHDVDGLAALYGGRQGLIDNIHEFLAEPEEAAYSGIHEAREARDVRLGMLGMSNQVAHHIPYVLGEAGDVSGSQELISEIQNRLFVGSDIGQGYPGDEDNGEFSAWYIFSALGFYPLAVGSGDYTVGSPMFDSATVHFGDTSLVVNADGASSGKNYVAGVDINGTSIDSTTFDGDLLREGGTLTYTMSSEPSTWGAKDLNEDLDVNDIAVDATEYGTFSAGEGTEVSKGSLASLSDNTMKSSVTLTGNEASLLWKSNSGPVAVDRYTLTALQGAGAPESWTLSGSLDGQTWVPVDEREGQTFPFGTQTRPFSADASTAFTHYKLDITGAKDKNLALAEIELFGGAGESTDLTLTGAEPISASVDEEVSSTLATLVGTEESAEGYTVKVSAGDGSDPVAGELTKNKLGGWDITAPHTYTEAGTYTVNVTAADSQGGTATGSTTVEVSRDGTFLGALNNTCIADATYGASCDGQGHGYMREKLADKGFTQGDTIPLEGTDLDFDLAEFVPGQHDNVTTEGQTFTVDLGEGATQLSLIGAATENKKDLVATLTFSDDSTQDVPIQFGDWVGASKEPAFTNSIVAVSEGRYSGTSPEGSVKNAAVFATEPVTLDTQADGSPKTAVRLTLPQDKGDLRNNGRAHIFAIASDGDRSATENLTVTGAEGLTVEAGSELSDTLASVTGGAADAELTATINWADGTATQAGEVAEGEVTGTHTYTEAGDYTAIVTVDDGVKSAAAEVSITVTEGAVYEPTLSADPESASAGDQVAITGSGFKPGEDVEVASGDAVQNVTAGKDGSISASIQIPKDATPGEWTITATGAESQIPARVSVSITEPTPGPQETSTALTAAPHEAAIGESVHLTAAVDPAGAEGSVEFVENGHVLGSAPVVGATASTDVTFASSGEHGIVAKFISDDDEAFTSSTSTEVSIKIKEEAAPDAQILLSDIQVQAGESLTVTGSGFAANEKVGLVLHSDPVELATVAADGQGAFTQVITIPSDTVAGKHDIVATGADSDQSATAQLTITVTSGGTDDGDSGEGSGNGSSGPDGDLSFTGAQVAGLIGIAVLAIAVGAVLIIVRKRKAGDQ